MNIRRELQIGTQHMTTKGMITIVNHYEENGVIYTTYSLNGVEITKKHSDVYKNVYYYIRKTNGTIPTRGMSSRRTRAAVEETIIELTYNRQLKFGVELEVTVPDKRELIEKLEAKGIAIKTPYASSTHAVVENAWKIVYDGSINAGRGYEGCEIVSPPSYNFNELKIVCDVLEEVGAKVNSSCGLHVHHDIKDLKRKQIIRIYNFYNKFEKYIDMIHKASRKNNRYAKSISGIIDRVNNSETRNELLRNVAGQGVSNSHYYGIRYYKINLRSFLYYGTIEFRQHAGTIKFEEISNWINFTHKIVERGLEIDNDVQYPTIQQEMEWGTTPAKAFEEMYKELHIENTIVAKYIEKKTKRKRNAAA